MVKRNSIIDIKNKKGQQKIVALTAYSFSDARIFDQYCDILLVGDTVGMIIYGMDNTLNVNLEMMINHSKAVVKGSKKALIIADMPFATYEKNKEFAFKNAAKLISKGGAGAVKIEYNDDLFDTVKFLVTRGIPVVGHIGLTPQHINQLGGFKHQGGDSKIADRIVKQAKDLQDAGACMIVIEGVKEKLASKISKKVKIPTIGIGASKDCDGQILVNYDMLGIGEKIPKFAKKYANLEKNIDDAVKKYAKEVRGETFPDETHYFN